MKRKNYMSNMQYMYCKKYKSNKYVFINKI